ncbi:hypothetical protein GCM10011511_10510 [Puia dinghuensis]|uniref:Uncharacterized protein n=1 Tax=Puia dinghuensis TaxID=1792502 RepID=A0A8J2UAG1_9BACT|nr:hypothetical protein GCM10011511_10510 [Puia dinghuensis]
MYAAADPELYSMIITFLEAPSFSSALSAGLIDKIERVRKPGLGGTRVVKEETVEEPVGVAGDAGGEPEQPAGSVEVASAAGSVEGARKRNLFAKTYFIAAELYYELKGQQAEFESLSRRTNKLAEFVKKQFHTVRLPGTFSDLRGYSYKPVLNGDNESRKGQLKPFFRQLSENPDVFGKPIAQRAQRILVEYF